MVYSMPHDACAMKSFAAILVLLALAGCSTNPPPPDPKLPPAPLIPWTENGAVSPTNDFKPARAIVRSVHGKVEFWDGSSWQPLLVNHYLTTGTPIRTGPGADVYLQVNGFTSTIKLSEDGQLDLTTMMAGRGSVTRTVLDVRKGTILGSVKKLSSQDGYQVRGGGVTMKVHGTDYKMSADGRVEIITGIATVTSDGKDYQVATGRYFDPKKNEVGKLPDRPTIPIDPRPGGITIVPFGTSISWPGSASLSPFDAGLQNARHGWR
jgi:hypothetical protein